MNVIGLGCSVSMATGWVEWLAHSMNVEPHNLSQGSSSNQVQIKRLQEHILNYGINNDDIIIWQITATGRSFYRSPGNSVNLEFAKQDKKDAQWDTYSLSRHPNIFDGMHRIDFLSHSRFALKVRWNPEVPMDWCDEPQILEDLLFAIIAAKKFTPNVIVFLGWSGAIHSEYLTTFVEHLQKHNIEFIDSPLVDWCKMKKLGFHDDSHPDSNATSLYAKEVIKPRLDIILNR